MIINTDAVSNSRDIFIQWSKLRFYFVHLLGAKIAKNGAPSHLFMCYSLHKQLKKTLKADKSMHTVGALVSNKTANFENVKVFKGAHLIMNTIIPKD